MAIDDREMIQDGETGRATSVRVGKNRYAVGLLWLDRQGSKSARREASDRAPEAGDASLFCFRDAETAQIGFGWMDVGHKSRQAALAAHLAASGPEGFLAAFKVNGGYVIAAVNQHSAILEDTFFGDEEKAYAYFREWLFSEDIDWDQQVFAPSEWTFDGVDVETADDIHEFLDGKPKIRLDAISRKVSPALVGVIGLTVAVAGFFAYSEYREQQRQARLERQQQEQKQETRQPHAFERRLKGMQVFQACLQAIRETPVSYPGYSAERITCDGREVQVHLASGELPGFYMRAYLERNDRPNAQVATNDGSVDTITYPLDASIDVWGRIPDSRIPEATKLTKNMRAYASVNDLDVVFRTRTETSNTDAHIFEIREAPSPDRFASWFRGIPAFTLSEMQLNIAEGYNWYIEGKFYETFRAHD